jgi:HEAT repeat protein
MRLAQHLLVKVVGTLGVFIAVVSGSGAAEDSSDADARILKDAGVPTEGKGLLDYLRSHTPADVKPEQVQPLVRQLGSERFEERERAAKDLIGVGLRAVPELRKALEDKNVEIARRAKECLQEIQSNNKTSAAPAAVVRQLRRERPAGALQALLAYLPMAKDQHLEIEVYYALDALAMHDGKTDPALTAALEDASPDRRAAAACVLGRLGNDKLRAAVRKLLTSPVPLVRLRAAQGLLAAKDKAAIPALATLLDEKDTFIAWQAEELLHYVAGEDSPESTVGAGGAEAGKKCREAWDAWWKKNEAKVDLAQLERETRRPGLILLCSVTSGNGPKILAKQNYRLWLCGCDGKQRWQMLDLGDPRDVQLLPENRLLLVDPSTSQVVERDLEGKAVWQKPVNQGELLGCRRLANGNTRVLTTNGFLELTSEGNAVNVFDYPKERGRPVRAVSVAQILNDGRIATLDEKHQLITYGPGGKEERRVKAEIERETGSIWALSDDRCLSVAYRKQAQEIEEIDGSNKVVRRFKVNGAMDARRLANGNTLFLGGGRKQQPVTELDQAGRMVWENWITDSPSLRAWPCLELVRFGFDGTRPEEAYPDSHAALTKALKSKDALTRRRALAALTEDGVKARAVMPDVRAALNDPDKGVRETALFALQKIGVDAIPVLIEALKNEDAYLRIHAALLLGKMNPVSGVAAPELIEALKDKHPTVRAEAGWSLSQLAWQAQKLEPLYIKSLDDEYADMRRNAIFQLGRLATNSNTARQAVLRALKAKDPLDRKVAAASLWHMRMHAAEIVPPLTEALKDESPLVRGDAALALGYCGDDAKDAVPALLEALRDERNDKKRESAEGIASALGLIGPGAKKAVPALIEMLKDASLNDDCHISTVRALGDIGPNAKDAVPAIRDYLNHAEQNARIYGFRALGQIGPETLPILLDRIRPDSGNDRYMAVEAIGLMGPAGKEAVPALLDLLNEKETDGGRARVIGTALVQIAPTDEKASSRLKEIFQDKNLRLHDAVATPLAMLAATESSVVPLLSNALRDKDLEPRARAEVAIALLKAGPGAKAAVPDLIEMLDFVPEDKRGRRVDPSFSDVDQVLSDWRRDPARINYTIREPRFCALLVLGNLGEKAKEAGPALAKIALDRDRELPLRRVAVWALGRIGTESKATLPALVGVIKDVDSPTQVRTDAVLALSGLGKDAAAPLVENLKEKDWGTRLLTLEALGSIGADTQEAVPALKKLEKGDDRLLRRAASNALERIQR